MHRLIASIQVWSTKIKTNNKHLPENLTTKLESQDPIQFA
jgi:hypothetical protein